MSVFQPPCGKCGQQWSSYHVCSTVPRVAASLSDLRVGQVVIPKSHIGWLQAVELNPPLTDKTAKTWFDKGWTVVILSDPPPEPVSVSRAAFDRLAEGIQIWDNRGDTLIVADAARALVDEVRRADA